MKKNLGILFLAIAAVGCGKSPEKSVYGSWKSTESIASIPSHGNDPSIKIFLALTLAQDKCTMTSICQFGDGTTLKANVSSPANITDSTIEITELHTKIEKVGSYSCSASLSPNKISYTIDGDSLTLQDRSFDKSIKLIRQ